MQKFEHKDVAKNGRANFIFKELEHDDGSVRNASVHIDFGDHKDYIAEFDPIVSANVSFNIKARNGDHIKEDVDFVATLTIMPGESKPRYLKEEKWRPPLVASTYVATVQGSEVVIDFGYIPPGIPESQILPGSVDVHTRISIHVELLRKLCEGFGPLFAVSNRTVE